MTAAELHVDADSVNDFLYPRDNPDFRYRVYALSADGGLDVLAATGTEAGIGTILATLHQDARETGGRLADHGRIGVLDVRPDSGSPVGDWIVNPFTP